MAFNLENTHTPAHNQLKKWDVDRMLKKEITLFGNSFKNKKKEAFYTELNVLLKAGLTLKDSLQLIIHEQKKSSDKMLMQDLLDQIVAGRNFSDAIKKQKSILSV